MEAVKENGSHISEADAQNDLMMFLLDKSVLSLIHDFHVVFRFKAGCQDPRNVDGKVAWTTKNTEVDSQSKLVRLAYKTKEGSQMKDEFVPAASLVTCLPNIRDDNAVVLSGNRKGNIVYPSHSYKDGDGGRLGLYCKIERSCKKRDAELFSKESITRARPIGLGPPSQ